MPSIPQSPSKESQVPVQLLKIPIPKSKSPATSVCSGSPRCSPAVSPRSHSRCLQTNYCRISGGNSVSLDNLIRVPQIQLVQMGIPKKSHDTREDINTPEFLSWRRLHLSSAKLSGITEIAPLMAGFSVVATVELQIRQDVNPYLLTAFTVTTVFLVATTMLAIMISTCILPYIQMVANQNTMVNHTKTSPAESPHDGMMWYIDVSWALANTISIFLFTLDIILLCWIKFSFISMVASWSATIIMIPVLLLICIFAMVFYRNVVKHQYIISKRQYKELEEMKKQLDSNDAITVVVV